MLFSAKLTSILSLSAFCATSSALVLSAERRQGTCTNPAVRQEWRSLSASQQAEYISAVQCLRTKPSQLTGVTANSKSLFDNFAEIVDNVSPQIFNTAYFFPWHRYFIHLYEQALQGCGYTGNLPYWDWTQDADDFTTSPLWSDTAFGGNGASGTLCVTTGPFANLQLNIPNEHCLKRNFITNNSTYQYPTPTFVNSLFGYDTDYSAFRFDMELSVSGGMELYIGGDSSTNIGDMASGDVQSDYVSWAPNDPIYFVHYANIDRLWLQWQQVSSDRETEYDGYKNRYDGNIYELIPASLTDSLPMFGGFAPEVTVSEVMVVEGGLDGALCYRYE